ncbi:hypothetical protein V5O48_016559, partial [Marasmius crinis-equi]
AEATELFQDTIEDGVKDKVEAADVEQLGRKNTGRSLASEILEHKQKETKDEEDYSMFYLFKRMGMINSSEWRRYIAGSIAACLTGLIYPAFGIVYGQAVNTFATQDRHVLRHEGDRNALWFFVIAILSFFCIGIQNYSFAAAAAILTSKLRSSSLKAILRQDIEYFDKDEHSSGSLTTDLSDDPQKVNGLAGITLGVIVQSCATLVGGIVVGLIFAWKLGLVILACTQLLITTGYTRLRVVVLKDQANKKAHAGSAQLACEAAGSIRTVASLTREEDCLQLYSSSLEEQLRKSNRTALWSNALYALSQAMIFLVIALVFWYGSRLVSTLEVSTQRFFIGLMGSASSIIRLLDFAPEIDTESTEGKKITQAETRGHIRFEGVHFRYPNRPGVRVLRDLNLQVEPGTYVALVGQSGCGKSTIIQMIERFYDPLAGTIYLDDQPINELNVTEYRKAIALVSQEPTLYAGTIRFNILLGAIKPGSEVTQEELEQAYRDANILEFIRNLPDGFDTEVGGKGSQLSGGQKQRIAIARALLRNPKVLLDEATSALDSNSEKVVQAALDQAAKGRTTIAIAHRLSTVQNADRIYFMKEGRVSEAGTHDQLLARRGGYYEFVQLQALSRK